MNNVDITPVLTAILSLVSAVITAFVIPWIRRSTTAKDREEMLKWVDIAVTAAQQLYYQSDGEKRKQYVLTFLANKGYNVDESDIDAAIEASVLKLHKELEEGKVN